MALPAQSRAVVSSQSGISAKQEAPVFTCLRVLRLHVKHINLLNGFQLNTSTERNKNLNNYMKHPQQQQQRQQQQKTKH